MDKPCAHKNPLQRNGISQVDRECDSLDPTHVSLHDLKLKDWVSFASEFSKQIHFYKDNATSPQGDWQAFFPVDHAQDEKIQLLLAKDDNEPHTALFFAFLKLMEVSQDHLNQLTKSHLDFYYKKVLQLSNEPFTPDKVHVIFELAKNANDYLIKEKTALNGGKDKDQKILTYQTDEDLVVNRAAVTELKTAYHQKGTQLRYADISNSSDGLGAALDKENPKWSAFGHNQLPGAEVGFALASSVLTLKEGIRTIRFILTLKSDTAVPNLSATDLQSALQIYLSGEKEWLGPFTPADKNAQDVKSGSFLTKSGSTYTLQVEIALNANVEPVIPYNEDVLQEGYNTSSPVVKFLINNAPGSTNKGYPFFNGLMQSRLEKSEIKVFVKGMKEMTGENDLGVLDLSKPFYPFGPQPIKGSNFFIGSKEVFDKEWDNVKLNIEWKDLPKSGTVTDFKKHYDAYRKKFQGNIGVNDYTITEASSDSAFDGQIVPGNDHFKATPYILENKEWESKTSVELFDNDDSKVITINKTGSPASSSMSFLSLFFGKSNFQKSVGYNYLTSSKNQGVIFDESKYAVKGKDIATVLQKLGTKIKKGFLKLSLDQSFLHHLYPKLYGISLMDNGTANKLIPSEPYTPVIESITMDYEAKTKQTLNLQGKNAKQILDNYNEKNIQLFHIGPHGQFEQHRFLKDQHAFFDSDLALKNIYLLPQYPVISEFYIGISNAEAEQSISILIQVAEGSENPELPTFAKNEQLKWSALCSNEWKPLNSDYIIENDTNNLLRSGIIKIQIPKQATQGNTRFPKDRIWLRAELDKNPFTVCQLFDVQTQSTIASFSNQSNDLTHLESSLAPESITKVIDRPALIKAVQQPYSSFGGKPEESDEAFYTRISERLRHKQRAVTIWDYEHLILQEFPEIYKVKCLNHSRFKSGKLKELAPGYVTVIVAPDLKNKNLFNRLQPRVSQNTLSEVEQYINKYVSLHVHFDAANPVYEEVKLEFDVLFRKGYDVNFYTKKINDDIIKFLSPWAYEETAEIDFGGTLYTSIIIDYLEHLEYVDFISNFKMFHESQPTAQKVISASNSAAILVSVEQHKINPLSPDTICP